MAFKRSSKYWGNICIMTERIQPGSATVVHVPCWSQMVPAALGAIIAL